VVISHHLKITVSQLPQLCLKCLFQVLALQNDKTNTSGDLTKSVEACSSIAKPLIMLPAFPTTYLCKSAFSNLVAATTKALNRLLDLESGLRCDFKN